MSPRAAGHRLIVDRFEGELAVVETEDGTTLDLPRWMLPADAREGDVLRARARGAAGSRSLQIRVDAEETARRRTDAAERVERLRARDPGGDIVL